MMPRGKKKVAPTDASQTADTKESTTVSVQSSLASEVSTTEVTTKAASKRDPENTFQEKISKDEKDNSPVIIISYKDNTGKRVTKQFTCDRIDLTENRRRTLQKSGPKTNLDIYIEATVVDEM